MHMKCNDGAKNSTRLGNEKVIIRMRKTVLLRKNGQASVDGLLFIIAASFSKELSKAYLS